MGNYSELKDLINNPTSHGLPEWDNGDNKIEGEMMKSYLLAIVNSLSSGGYLFAGVAKLTPTQTDPGTPDQNVFYIATEPGTYTNFVGAGGPLVVAKGEVAIFKYNGTWSKEVTGAASAAQVTELGQYIENPEFIGVWLTNNNKILLGIKKDGDIVFGCGVPNEIKRYLYSVISNYTDTTTLTNLLNNKVDKVLGKSLINSDYANSQGAIESPEYLSILADKSNKLTEVYTKKGKSIPSLELCQAELIICGTNASAYQLQYAKRAERSGFGLICSNDEEVNDFINKFKGVEATFRFFGTITCAHGIIKYPEHNLIGYGCKLIMGNQLGNDYWGAIICRPSGHTTKVGNKEHYICYHNYTCIKGFYLDGNANNNCTTVGGVTTYNKNSVYGALILFGNYDIWTTDFDTSTIVSHTQVVIEDLYVMNSMRGFILGPDMIARNIIIGDAFDDHNLYIAGASRTVVENVRITGTCKTGGAHICVSPSMAVQKDDRVQNVVLRDIYVYEPTNTVLQVRGNFSNVGNNCAVNNIFIDGIYVKKTGNLNFILTFGTPRAGEVVGTTDYSYNIVVRDAYIKADTSSAVMAVYGANVNFENCVFDLTWITPRRSLFYVESKEYIKNAISLRNCRLKETSSITSSSSPWGLFKFDPNLENNVINGLDIDGLVISGNNNYYLFDASDAEEGKKVTVNNLTVNRLDASPLGVVNPDALAHLEFTNDYYEVNV